MADQRVYVTTPIFYVNDRPHIGHIYTTTLCDAYARFMRFSGHDVFFLTGTDEHGVKVERSAQARGVTPQALADENAAVFQRVLPAFKLTNSDFIRTTQPSHVRQVQAFVRRLLDSGHIYLGEFEGWYDEGQEEYYTETKAKDVGYISPVSKRPLVRAKEKNYYFRLSAFQKPLEKLFAERPGFVQPEARRNEVLGRLREGIQDVPVTRTNFTWGIGMPPPGDKEHVIYVWIDALFNYISALGLGEPGSELARERSRYWPATYHVIGKEILWFHAVIWPALLMALELPLPHCVYAHSFWISEGQKMSKTMGNFIDLEAIQRYVDRYGLDAWRYYLITQGPLGAQDADFAAARFQKVYNDDLVNTVGNCASRVTAMIEKYFDKCAPTPPTDTGAPPAASGANLPELAAKAVREATAAMTAFELSDAVAAPMRLLRSVDAHIHTTEPFKIAKDPARRDELATILYQCLEAVRIASLLLWPVLPEKMEDLWSALSVQIDPEAGQLANLTQWGGISAGAPIRKVALYPRVEMAAPPTGTAPAAVA